MSDLQDSFMITEREDTNGYWYCVYYVPLKVCISGGGSLPKAMKLIEKYTRAYHNRERVAEALKEIDYGRGSKISPAMEEYFDSQYPLFSDFHQEEVKKLIATTYKEEQEKLFNKKKKIGKRLLPLKKKVVEEVPTTKTTKRVGVTKKTTTIEEPPQKKVGGVKKIKVFKRK